MGAGETATESVSPVRILSFSSPDCHQCKQLQAPALERVLEARQENVAVMKVDVTTEQDLTQAYRVLTVPSTVVLDKEGQAHAVNYGFTNTHRLLAQVDEVLAKVASLQ
jgi:thioredoxin-like negative regulator of GroEL